MEDTNFAKCNICATLVCRGGKSPKTHTTMNLVNHLKIYHKEVFAEFKNQVQQEQQSKGSEKPPVKQLT